MFFIIKRKILLCRFDILPTDILIPSLTLFSLTDLLIGQNVPGYPSCIVIDSSIFIEL